MSGETPAEQKDYSQTAPKRGWDRRRLAAATVAVALYLAAWGVGLALIPLRRAGGDSVEMAMYVESPTSCFYVRSPLTLYLHRAVYRAIRPLGFRGQDAMALCSAAAGGAFLLALLSISRHWLFLAFNLISGTVFLFFGHLENYAWVNALLVVYLALLKRHVDGKAPLWPAAVALLLACLFHMLAVFSLPALACAVWRWDGARRRLARRIGEKDWEMTLLAFVIAAIIAALGPMALGPAAGLDNNAQRLVPLFSNPDPVHYFFTMFSAGHFKMLAYFHWMASPLGLIVLVALGWRIRGRYERLVLAAALCGLSWTFVWHPDMHRADWDLFSSFAFPLNVLDGLLLAGLFKKDKGRRTKERKMKKRFVRGEGVNILAP